MDGVALRDRVVTDYRGYIESFVRIRDERAAGFVDEILERGDRCPLRFEKYRGQEKDESGLRRS